MGAISALSTTSRALKRNTVLFAAAFVVAFVNGVPSGITYVLPAEAAGLLSLLLSLVTFVLTPFFIGGLLSMADEGTDGTTRLGTFVEGGKDNYLRLLGAMVLFAVLVGVLATVVLIGVGGIAIFTVGMNSAGAAGPMAAGGPGLGPLLLLGLVGALLVLLPVFFLQLYAPAVVVSGLGVVDSLKRSAAVVRRNLVSTLGYSVITAVIGLIAGVGGFAISMTSSLGVAAGTSSEFGPGLVVAGILVALLVSTAVSAFGSVYQVAFYKGCLESLD